MIATPRTFGARKLHVLQGSPEWLEARRTHITATMIPVILGLDPWRSEQDLADEILGGNGTESTLRMRVGSALEDLILAAYVEQTGRPARHVRGLWESRTHPRAAASPDATAAGRLVEIKWSGSRSTFAGPLPERIEAQARWQAFVAEVNEVDVVTLTVGDDEVKVYPPVVRDHGIEANLIIAADDFRARLAAGGPFAQSLENLKRRHPADDGTEMIADAELDSAVRARADLLRRSKQLAENAEAMEVIIKTRMGPIARLVGEGWTVTWKKAKDGETTDWKLIADGLLRQMPEPEAAGLVGLHTTVREGARYFRVAFGKGDTE